MDVSESALRGAAAALADDYPGLDVRGVVGDFLDDLHRLPAGDHRMVAFLGGTIGNLSRRPGAVLPRVATTLGPSDALLLGTDLVKHAERLLQRTTTPPGSRRRSTATSWPW